MSDMAWPAPPQGLCALPARLEAEVAILGAGIHGAALARELTLRGVTQPMRLKISRITCESGPLSLRQSCRADASGALQRSRFGMRSDLPFIGDEVRLRIQAEAHMEH